MPPQPASVVKLSAARRGHDDLCAVIREAHRHDDEALAILGFSRIEAPYRKASLRGKTRYAMVEAIREGVRTWKQEVEAIPAGPLREESEREVNRALRHVRAADEGYWSVALRFESVGVQEAGRVVGRLHTDSEDVLQWVRMALYTAAVRFDPDRDVLFSTYAKWWVRSWCYRKVQPEGTLVHVPAPAKVLSFQVRRLYPSGDIPSAPEVAAALSIRVDQAEDVLFALGAQQAPLRLDAPIEDGSGSDAVEFEAGDEAPSTDPILVRRVLSLLEELSPKERDVISSRFGIGRSGSVEVLAHLSARHGLSRERIRQIEREAMGKLTEAVRDYVSEEDL